MNGVTGLREKWERLQGRFQGINDPPLTATVQTEFMPFHVWFRLATGSPIASELFNTVAGLAGELPLKTPGLEWLITNGTLSESDSEVRWMRFLVSNCRRGRPVPLPGEFEATITSQTRDIIENVALVSVDGIDMILAELECESNPPKADQSPAKMPTPKQLARVRKAIQAAGKNAVPLRVLTELKADNLEGKGMRNVTCDECLRILAEKGEYNGHKRALKKRSR